LIIQNYKYFGALRLLGKIRVDSFFFGSQVSKDGRQWGFTAVRPRQSPYYFRIKYEAGGAAAPALWYSKNA